MSLPVNGLPSGSSEGEKENSDILDRAAKLVIRSAPQTAFLLAGATIPPGASFRTEDINVNVAEHRADHVLILEAPGDRYGIQAEYEAAPDPRKHRGWLLKNAALNVYLDLPVFLVVYYLQKGNRNTFPSRSTIERPGLRNSHEFDAVKLWKHKEEIRSGRLQELAPFLALCENEPTVETLEDEKSIIQSLNVSDERRRELMAVSLMVGRRQFTDAVLEKVFREELPMLKELGFVNEWIAQSRDEGRTEEARKNLLTVLRYRFGQVPVEVERRVALASAAWCEERLTQAITVGSAQELL